MIQVPAIFEKIDRIKPVYDVVERFTMLLCKLLLIVDVLITTMAVIGRYVWFIPDPAWSEEVVLSCMAYMAVLSAAIALRRNSHIRMTAFDRYLPRKALLVLDLVADLLVLAFAIVMLKEGLGYALQIGRFGKYTSLPWLSKFWMYFPIPLAGIIMIVFEVEIIYRHIRAFFVKEVDAA